MMSVHQNYIAGAWAEAAEPAPNINPSNLSDVVGEYARANETQVRAAIAAARAAFPAWSRGGVQARADMLDKIGNEILARKDELGVLLWREEGRTRPEASAKRCARAISSSSLPARWCARPAKSCPRCAPGSRWKSPASPSAWSGSSRR